MRVNAQTLVSVRRRNVLAVALVGALLLPLALSPLPAAAAACRASSPPGRAYTVTVCITQPADGATVSGSATVTVTVSVVGSNPGISKLLFTLAGQYLLTDFQAPYTFTLQTARFVDGTKLLQAEARMRDSLDRKSTRLNSSHLTQSRMPSSA